MAYALTREKAMQAAEITGRMVEAFSKDLILEYEPGHQGVPYLAYKVRELMASLVEYPDLIPPDAYRLVMLREYMIVAKPKKGLVQVVPRRRVAMKAREADLRTQTEFKAPMSMSVDLDWSDGRDLLRIKGLLDLGTVEFTGVHSVPKREEVQRILEQRLEREIEDFDPPTRILFRTLPK